MNEIAMVKQLPIITEQIKMVGEKLDKRLNDLKLNELVCTEETKKSIKDLRTDLGNELKIFEEQRKDIKKKIMEPYEVFNTTYENEIKTKYQNADIILKNKIDEVENGIKKKTEEKAIEFFEEYRASKSVIKDNYLNFDELNIKIGLNLLTTSDELVKKVKDEIKEKVDAIEKELETILTMNNSEEILVEYLKYKNLSIAIKEVNDRHLVLEQVQRQQEEIIEIKNQEEEVIEKVENVLQAPIVEEISVVDEEDEVLTLTFRVKGTRKKLKELKQFLIDGGYEYE